MAFAVLRVRVLVRLDKNRFDTESATVARLEKVAALGRRLDIAIGVRQQ